jgi:hypothetical protein
MFGLFRRKKEEPLPPSPQLMQRVERLTRRQRLQRAGGAASSPSSTDDYDDGTNALTTGIGTVAALDVLQSGATVEAEPATADAC